MSGLGRRLRPERDLWYAVWRQVETFLDRIDSAVGDDERHAKTMCVLFPVFDVIERARERSVGYRLSEALRAVPGGAGGNGLPIATVAGATLVSGLRIPGVEDCEFAVAGYAPDSGTIDRNKPISLLSRSVNLATFRDEKHGQVLLRTPTYDFGHLDGAAMQAIPVGDGGLFPPGEREKATNGDEFRFTRWTDLRNFRVQNAKTIGADAATPLSAKLSALLAPEVLPPKHTEVRAIGDKARGHARQCRHDSVVLERAKASLSEAGIDGDVTGAIATASATMSQQALDFDFAADKLSNGAGYTELLGLVQRLSVAEGVPGASGLPVTLERLDLAAAKAMNEAVESRIGYPDGPLRQLRMLQWSLRVFWEQRRAWMRWRHDFVLARPYAEYMRGFTLSLERVLNGQPSGIPLPANSKIGRPALALATEVPLAGIPDLSSLAAGQIVVVGGERPTAAPVVEVLFDGKKLPPLRLKVPPLVVSLETGKDAGGRNIPGMPGLIPLATPLGDRSSRLEDAELRRGASRRGPAGDALVRALVAHGSRLALVLGDAGGPGGRRPAPPPIAKPYPALHRFDLEGPITSTDNRLFLKTVPPASASGTGEPLPMARPGEMVLLYGRDEDGIPWQTAVEVDHVVIATGGEAKKDESAGATPVPPCCAHDEPVMVVYVRPMQFPGELHDAFLHRSFAGFGAPSLFTGVLLPEEVDPDTASTVQVGSQILRPRRDPELRAAVRVFDEWMPKETE